MLMFTTTHRAIIQELNAMTIALGNSAWEAKSKIREQDKMIAYLLAKSGNYPHKLVDEMDQQINDLSNQILDLERQLAEKNTTSFRYNSAGVAQFSDAELKKLIQLCHPDKHKSSPLSVEISTKINQLRRG